MGGKDFVFQNDADKILFRSRLGPIFITVLLALLVFLATWDMFGKIPAFIALGLVAFDPNFIAHGALVMTDVAPACFIFAAIYAFYRYAKAPSIWRIVLLGVGGGLALASKHTGVLLFPMLALLAFCELLWCKGKTGFLDHDHRGGLGHSQSLCLPQVRDQHLTERLLQGRFTLRQEVREGTFVRNDYTG